MTLVDLVHFMSEVKYCPKKFNLKFLKDVYKISKKGLNILFNNVLNTLYFGQYY